MSSDSTFPQKILIVRTDRIGDVVLSLPMIAALRSLAPGALVAFLLRSYTKDLVRDQQGLDQILLYDRGGVRKKFREMLSEIRSNRFDAVIVTYPTLRLGLLAFFARIPWRIGTGFRWYSFLFNKKVFEHRKTAEKHEAEYNLSLLRVFGDVVEKNALPKLMVTKENEREAMEVLHEMSMTENSPFVILHPGSGGSARDWRPESFGKLGARLAERGLNVVVTGGPAEERLKDTVVQHSKSTAKALPRALPLLTLAALIRKAAVFVSNSTGPLHIAAAVGTPVVAFYPPIRQCSPTRWGPLTDRKVIFEPRAADCPRCKGGPCESNVCMDLITVEAVEKAVNSLLAKTESHPVEVRR
ncbi:MAG: glycosyltransferase family 9 protein [Bacteroidota bacterium]